MNILRSEIVWSKLLTNDTIAEDTSLSTIMDFVNTIDKETERLKQLNLKKMTEKEEFICSLMRPKGEVTRILNKEVTREKVLEEDEIVHQKISFSQYFLIYEIVEAMEGLVRILINFYETSPVLKIYRKFSHVYDVNRWSATFHREVHMDVVDWMYSIVIVQLALNRDLPFNVRYMKKKEFRRQITKWLKIANEHKQRNKLGKL